LKQAVIREITEDRGKICDALLHSLPRWFDIETAIRQYVIDVEEMPTFAAFVENRPVGFVSLKRHNEWTAEVHVMAVLAEFHRGGIGRKLIESAQGYLRGLNYKFLSAKTLSPSRPSQEYEMTRKFYFSMGFRPVEEFKTLWGEANPCLLMIKAL
jgi:ribosomal protein S18 acetylase RimI-like enzyme